MDAYVYNGDLYCTECVGDAIKNGQWLKYQFDGPYPNGGGEADTPQSCGNCHVFLQNPLTPDGIAYVRELAQSAHRKDSAVVREWAKFYCIEIAA